MRKFKKKDPERQKMLELREGNSYSKFQEKLWDPEPTQWPSNPTHFCHQTRGKRTDRSMIGLG